MYSGGAPSNANARRGDDDGERRGASAPIESSTNHTNPTNAGHRRARRRVGLPFAWFVWFVDEYDSASGAR